MRYFVECSFLYHRKFRWNPLWYEKELRAGSHCGGRVICRRSDPPQAENPADRIHFYERIGKLQCLRSSDITGSGSKRECSGICGDRRYGSTNMREFIGSR